MTTHNYDDFIRALEATSVAARAARDSLKELAEERLDSEEDEHGCSCSTSSFPPCGHCTDCMFCNCHVCEDFHDTSNGETCPMCETCGQDHVQRKDGICPTDISVSGSITQQDLENMYSEWSFLDLGDILQKIAQRAAEDAIATAITRIKSTHPDVAEQVYESFLDDYEIAVDDD